MASPRRYLAYLDYYLGRAKYLFIHIPKNAGVAVRRSPELKGQLVATEPGFYKSREYLARMRASMRARHEHHGLHHARLQDMHPRIRRQLTAVAVIRNPWSRVVSRYRFAQLVIAGGRVADGYAPESFEAFLEERFRYGGEEFYWHRAVRGWYPQRDYVVNEDGHFAADLLRQEYLSDECQRYFGTQQPLRRRNSSGKQTRPYQSYYTPRTIQIVADWYRDDIEAFGFDFDTPARRNTVFTEGAIGEAA